MASAFQSIQIHVWLMQKTKTILLLYAVSAARLDSYGCVQEKTSRRGDLWGAGKTEQWWWAVQSCGFVLWHCYGKTLLVISPHHAGLCCHSIMEKKNCPIVPPTSASLLDPPWAAASKKKGLIRVRHVASRWPNALHLLGCRPVRPRPRHPCTHQVLKRFVHLTWASAAHCIEAFLPLPSCPKFVWGLHAALP